MKLPRRNFLHLAASVAALPVAPRIAFAQTYPSRPVTVIVPFAPGGATDVVGRIVGEYFSRTLGQQFVIENVAGAGGTTGTTRTMRAAPDGYTIQVGQMGTHAAAVAFYPNLAYKPDVDFEPIGMIAGLPIVITARKDFPANDLNEFIRYVKANAGKVNPAHARHQFYYTHHLPAAPFAARRAADLCPVQRRRAGHECIARRAGRLHVQRHPRLCSARSGRHG